MSPKDFFIKVEALRKVQKEYFATRAPSSLSAAKRLEAEIDAEIIRVRLIKPCDQEDNQLTMYNKENRN